MGDQGVQTLLDNIDVEMLMDEDDFEIDTESQDHTCTSQVNRILWVRPAIT